MSLNKKNRKGKQKNRRTDLSSELSLQARAAHAEQLADAEELRARREGAEVHAAQHVTLTLRSAAAARVGAAAARIAALRRRRYRQRC